MLTNFLSTDTNSALITPNNYVDCTEFFDDNVDTVTLTVTSTGITTIFVTTTGIVTTTEYVTTTITSSATTSSGGALGLNKAELNDDSTTTICQTVIDGCNEYETTTFLITITTDYTSTPTTQYVTDITVTTTEVNYESQTYTAAATTIVTYTVTETVTETASSAYQLNLNQQTITCTSTQNVYIVESIQPGFSTSSSQFNITSSDSSNDMSETEDVVESDGDLKLPLQFFFLSLGIIIPLILIRHKRYSLETH